MKSWEGRWIFSQKFYTQNQWVGRGIFFTKVLYTKSRPRPALRHAGKKHFGRYRATNCESVSHYFGLIFCVFSKVKGNLVHQTHEITSLLDQRISVGSIDTNPISHMHPGYTKVPLCLLLLLPISSKFLIIFLYIHIYYILLESCGLGSLI